MQSTGNPYLGPCGVSGRSKTRLRSVHWHQPMLKERNGTSTTSAPQCSGIASLPASHDKQASIGSRGRSKRHDVWPSKGTGRQSVSSDARQAYAVPAHGAQVKLNKGFKVSCNNDRNGNTPAEVMHRSTNAQTSPPHMYYNIAWQYQPASVQMVSDRNKD